MVLVTAVTSKADGFKDDDLKLESDPSLSIALQELYPIVIACFLWGKQWQRKRVLFHCDNLATVYIINKGLSKSTAIMKLMRRLVLIAATCNFAFCAEHIPGTANIIADSLSRFQTHRFKMAAPVADKLPHAVPLPSQILFS